MRMSRPRFLALYSSAKLLTDFKEARSMCITSTVALGDSVSMVSLSANPDSILRAAITTCAPCIASTLAVSRPIPDVAPTTFTTQCRPFLLKQKLRDTQRQRDRERARAREMCMHTSDNDGAVGQINTSRNFFSRHLGPENASEVQAREHGAQALTHFSFFLSSRELVF